MGFFRDLAGAEASGQVDGETIERITAKYGAAWWIDGGDGHLVSQGHMKTRGAKGARSGALTAP